MEQRVTAWIGLGANVGEPRAALAAAVSALASLPGASLAGVSRLYRTRPVGPVAQDHFLNAVVGLYVPAGATPEAGAMAILLELKALERSLGRVDRERWGPREIDLDLLLFGDHAIEVERPAAAYSEDPVKPGGRWLRVPHAAAAERLFVLAPLAELAPDLQPPGWHRTVADACAAAVVAEGPDAVEAVGAWDPQLRGWRPLGDQALRSPKGGKSA